MKRFRFKLQALLNYRQKLEDDAKEVLGKAMQTEELLKRDLDTLDLDRRSMVQEQSKLLAMSVGGEYYMQCISYQQDLFTRIEKKMNEIRQQHMVVEQKRRLLIKATQNRKALDIIREKKHAEFKKEQNAAETKFLDDISQRKVFFNKDK